jgi:hypothetical protein
MRKGGPPADGQIHYQDATGKYIYDIKSGQFRGLDAAKNGRLLKQTSVQNAIAKGLHYLGEKP